MKNETTEQTADTDDEKENNKQCHYQKLACCFGILCVILLAGLVAVFVVLGLNATLSGERNQTTLLAEIQNLTNQRNKLSVDNNNLTMERNNLTVELSNLTKENIVLDSNITNLTTRNQDLENQKNNLTQRIQDMETNWNEQNISRAQWSIYTYCIDNDAKQCNSCRKGWLLNQTSCYAVVNPEDRGQKTWEEAREDCRGKNADLSVVLTEKEKDTLNYYSWGDTGYWIGLRAEGGKWKWMDGTELAQTSWIGDATEGHCAVSIQGERWSSVSCGARQRWICIQDALSL
ncbi:C-type lectin domain family 10 member A-like [Cyclopterus lumpus]|uniref:C-type lectin domain family 10 member A-like n=1 Tax=Cyclopterus lumpus TaxID=8103 RepID=UPI001486A93C|nr:C-type lectin domain family 10 member A-like [Cyclopterus lumpus]